MRRPAAIQAVLALAMLGAGLVPWSRTCSKEPGFPPLCSTTVVWSQSVGVVASLFAAALLAHELRSLARPAPNDGATGFLLGAITGASLALSVALRLVYSDRWHGAGTWLALSLSVPTVIAALARLRAHVLMTGLRREPRRPEAIAAPRPAALILLLAMPAAFASLFLPWLGLSGIGAGSALSNGWSTFPAAVAGVLAVATIVAELPRLLGVQSLALQLGLSAIGCGIFFLLAVGLAALQARDLGGGLAYGAWLALGLGVLIVPAGAATLVDYAREM